jgi:hypothetical protein
MSTCSDERELKAKWLELRRTVRTQIQVAQDRGLAVESVLMGAAWMAVLKTQIERQPAVLTPYMPQAVSGGTITIFGLPVILYANDANALNVVTSLQGGNKAAMYGFPSPPKDTVKASPKPEPTYLPEGREVEI